MRHQKQDLSCLAPTALPIKSFLKAASALIGMLQQQPQGTWTSVLWADPWHISASSIETAAGNCLPARRNGSHTETWVQTEVLQHQLRNPEKKNIPPSVSLLVHLKHRAPCLKAYLHLLVNTNLFIPKKNHAVEATHTTDPSPVYLGSKRLNLFFRSTDKFRSSSFPSRFSCLYNKQILLLALK